MTGHTPAPWTFDRQLNQVFGSDANGKRVNVCGAVYNRDDAAVITAALELLDVVKDAMPAIESYASADIDFRDQQIAERARAAIAKTETTGGAP